MANAHRRHQLRGLMAARVQNRVGTATTDFAVARLCARAGLEASMYRIRTEPAWRTKFGNGAWYSNVTLGQGKFSVSATDPISGERHDRQQPSVLLTSTGTKGAAVYKLQVQVQVNLAAVTCIEWNPAAAVIPRSSTPAFLPATRPPAPALTSAPSPAPLSTPTPKHRTFGSGTYGKAAQKIGTAARCRIRHVVDYYVANASSIPYAALYKSNTAQIAANPASRPTSAAGTSVHPAAGASRSRAILPSTPMGRVPQYP